MNTNLQNNSVIDDIDSIAEKRNLWIKKNQYYYDQLIYFLKYNVPEKSNILEIGCGTGYILNNLNPKRGIGIDISEKMISIAKSNYSKNKNLSFLQMDAETISLREKFDYIIISDSVGYFSDVQKIFSQLRKVTHPSTRIIINFHSFLWSPVLNLAESLKIKMPYKKVNWLNSDDIEGLLYQENFEVIKHGGKILFPLNLPPISNFANRYLANLPILNKLCLTNFIIAKPIFSPNPNNKLFSVSVVIPARNEKGNIENAIKKLPNMGKHTEIIFVEGNSTDETLEEIKRVCLKYSKKRDLKYFVQSGKGKGDAVRKGFEHATGDILMILDADLTVPPEDLPKFYNAIATGKGEFINGSRLVYPMEKEAMRTLNIFANKFFSIMFTWLLGQKIKDTLCGTKVIFKKDYEKLIQNRSYFGNFDPFGDFDLLFGASKMNLKIVEVPIRYKAREYGTTNISRFRHGWLLLKMVVFAMNKIKFI